MGGRRKQKHQHPKRKRTSVWKCVHDVLSLLLLRTHLLNSLYSHPKSPGVTSHLSCIKSSMMVSYTPPTTGGRPWMASSWSKQIQTFLASVHSRKVLSRCSRYIEQLCIPFIFSVCDGFFDSLSWEWMSGFCVKYILQKYINIEH